MTVFDKQAREAAAKAMDKHMGRECGTFLFELGLSAAEANMKSRRKSASEERAEYMYGPTPQGQKLYDFGFAKLTDKWLAKKYQMPLPEVRQLKADVLKALKPKRRKRKP